MKEMRDSANDLRKLKHLFTFKSIVWLFATGFCISRAMTMAERSGRVDGQGETWLKVADIIEKGGDES